MKKLLMVFCCTVFVLAAVAEPKTTTTGKRPANAQRSSSAGVQRQNGGFQRQNGGFQPQNGGFQMPTIIKIDGNTTAQQVKDFKKQVNDKIDAAFKARQSKGAAEAKQPATIIFFVNEGGFDFGAMGMMGQQGFGGQGMGGMPPGFDPNMMPAAPAK